VRDRGAQLNVAHTLAAHNASRYFNATLVADDALVANALVLTAVTLVILFRTEYLLVEESVLLRTLGAVVDGLRLGDLT